MVARTRKDGTVDSPTDVATTDTPDAKVGSQIQYPEITEGALRDITDLKSAMDIIRMTTGAEVIQASEEVGDGFDFIERSQKDRLVGRPVLFVKWDCTLSSSYTRDNAAIRCVNVWAMYEAPDGSARKVRFVDFGTGVCQQLWELYGRTGRSAGLALPRGLRKSEFTYTDPDNGAQSLAATYYVDLSRE